MLSRQEFLKGTVKFGSFLFLCDRMYLEDQYCVLISLQFSKILLFSVSVY